MIPIANTLLTSQEIEAAVQVMRSGALRQGKVCQEFEEKFELAVVLKERDVATGVHYPRGLHQQPIFGELYGQISLPVCERICQEILALPVHHGLSSSQVEYILKTIEDIQDTRS